MPNTGITVSSNFTTVEILVIIFSVESKSFHSDQAWIDDYRCECDAV